MKICSLSVGKDFCEKYSQKVREHAPKNIDLIILTDHPEYFDFCKTELYSEKQFSYFSKNTFSSKICKETKEDVLYVDIDSFHLINEEIYTDNISSKYFLYHKLWKEYSHTKINSLPKELLDYYKTNSKDDIENFNEYLFYLPYSEKIEKLYQDLLKVKVIWDSETSNSTPSGNARKYINYGIGWGESIPFSFCLFMNGIEKKQYDLTKTSII